MDVSLLIRLIDQVSAPAKKVGAALGDIGDRAGKVAQDFRSGFGQAIRQGFSVENIETATKNAEAALGRARGRLLGAFGQAMALGAPVFKSAQFDQSMRGLDKVLDVTVDRLQQLRRFALDTSALVPIAARDLVELMAEAAQGGVPEEELEAFSLYVANAAVAFDMAGAVIGERFAKLRNVYRLNQQGIEDLGDATNHLSNNMAAKASEITDFANRAAGAAGILKLTAVEMSAVGTAMIAAGIVPETAARGLNTLATRVVTGGKQVDAAFKTIGMSRKKFLAELEQDAPAAIQKLFETLAKSDQGIEALVGLVGRDFADDFAKFLGNPELLAKAFALVAEQSEYAGSAVDEAGKQAAGAVKKWELLQGKLARIAVIVGDQLLPSLLDAADRIGVFIDRLAEFAQANPELASGAVQAAAALMGLSIASRLLSYAVALVRVPLVGLIGTFLKFNEAGRNVAIGWRVLAGAGRMLAGSFTLFGGLLGLVKGALVAVGGALAGITAPIWAVVAVIAAAGFALWKYWDRVSSFVSGFASVFSGAIGSAVSGAIGLIDSIIGKIAELLGIDAGRFAAFKAAVWNDIASAFDFSGLIDGAREVLSGFWSWLGSFFSAEQLTDSEKAEMYEAGRALAQSLIDGLLQYLTDGWAAVEGWVSGKVAWLRDKFTFEWPSWLGGGAEDAEAGNRSAAISNSAVSGTAGGSDALAGMDNIAAQAEADMKRGGAAVADGGEQAGQALVRGAQAIASAAQSAAEAIRRAASGSGSAGLARGIERAASGALHDGVD